MNIAGWQKISLTEDPGHVACVLFVPGCSLNCAYCQNRWLTEKSAPSLSTGKVLKYLKKGAGHINSVVVRGGEPTLQPDIKYFLNKIKGWGHRVRLHTMGTKPDVLQELIERGLIDTIVMDLKAPESRFAEICGPEVPYENVESSIELLLASGVEHEFRIIVAPLYSRDDVISMARSLPPDQSLVLQPYWQRRDQDIVINPEYGTRPYDPEGICETARLIRSFLPRCQVQNKPVVTDYRLAKRVADLLYWEENEA